MQLNDDKMCQQFSFEQLPTPANAIDADASFHSLPLRVLLIPFWDNIFGSKCLVFPLLTDGNVCTLVLFVPSIVLGYGRVLDGLCVASPTQHAGSVINCSFSLNYVQLCKLHLPIDCSTVAHLRAPLTRLGEGEWEEFNCMWWHVAHRFTAMFRLSFILFSHRNSWCVDVHCPRECGNSAEFEAAAMNSCRVSSMHYSSFVAVDRILGSAALLNESLICQRFYLFRKRMNARFSCLSRNSFGIHATSMVYSLWSVEPGLGIEFQRGE